MKFGVLCIFALVAVNYVAAGESDVSKNGPADINTPPVPVNHTTKPSSTTVMPTSTEVLTTSVSPSSTESPKPTSSTEAPKTTTEAPKTTTEPPKTTTEPPKTTPPPTTTSTPAPTSTSTPAPTTPSPVTTPAPEPTPSTSGNWTVSNGTVLCIMMQMELSAEISYELMTPNKTAKVMVKVPSQAKATGKCDDVSENVLLTWGNNSIEMMFNKNNTQYSLTNITLKVLADNQTFPNISTALIGKVMDLTRSSSEFKTAVGSSYRCMREQSLPLHLPNSSNSGAVLHLSNVQLQAFHDKDRAVFGDPQDCELDTPDIVPIAVGCALAGLVVVVLIAYLVGRRRSQARGYLSM